MRLLFYILVFLFAGPAFAACETPTKATIAAWPAHIGLLQLYVADQRFDSHHCVEIEMVSLNDIGKIDSVFQNEPGVVLFADLNTLGSNRNRVLETGQGEEGVIVGKLGSATYGLFARTGAILGAGSIIAVARCGWNDRDLTEPLPPEEKDEALSVPTLVILPYLREYVRNKNLRIWCGGKPPDNFSGILLSPLGSGGKRQAAFDGPADAQGRRVDFVVHSIDRSTTDVVSGKMELLAGPDKLRPIPETVLVARKSCLAETTCRGVVENLVLSIEEARKYLLDGGVDRVTAEIQAFAASAGEGKGAIKGASDPVVAGMMGRYLLEYELPHPELSAVELGAFIAENGWNLGVSDLIDPGLIVLK
jgi:hypothetical protein